MEGAVVMIIFLVVFPVLALIGMGILAAALGSSLNASVNAEYKGSPLLEMANFDAYDAPAEEG
ncbi:MAG: hypothetical protein OES57_05860 [Acidimicrobiia bacterium]|nr:hypothetical protein [Acidimicrobiia bacterium]